MFRCQFYFSPFFWVFWPFMTFFTYTLCARSDRSFMKEEIKKISLILAGDFGFFERTVMHLPYDSIRHQHHQTELEAFRVLMETTCCENNLSIY